MFDYIQEVLIMTTAFAIRTLIEIAAVLFVIFGVLHEQKFIDFENKVIRFIAKRIYLRKRKKAIERKRAAQQARRQRSENSFGVCLGHGYDLLLT